MKGAKTLRVQGGRTLAGRARVPADKSITHRALIFAAMSEGRSEVRAYGPGEDNYSTARCLRELGAEVQETQDGWAVESEGWHRWRAPTSALDCGNSGTTIRLLCGALAGLEDLGTATLVGDASLGLRPMKRITEPLRTIGGKVSGQARDGNEFTPLSVQGRRLAGGSHKSPIASAQVKSSLLLAALGSGAPMEVHEPHLSRDHSERMLRALGVEVDSTITDDGSAHIRMAPFSRALQARDWIVPGDISSATFLLGAALTCEGEEVVLEEVGVNPTRTGVLDALGAAVVLEDARDLGGEPVATLRVRPEALPDAIVLEGGIIPRLIDEIPMLACIGAASGRDVIVRDAAELRVKESDRVEESARLLRSFGAIVDTAEDGFRVAPGAELRPAEVEVGSDHRIALAAACLSASIPGVSELHGFDVANVSFPEFCPIMERLGASLDQI